MAMMKAAQLEEYGDASVMRINEVEVPVVGPGKLLVEVHASSINPFDTSVREGYMKEAIPLELPVTLGGDIAGVVMDTGDGVTHVSKGDKVYGQANVVAGNSGAFAEVALTAGGQVAKMPENLDFQQAASLPLVGVSAWQATTQHINLQAGQKLFVHGGAGGIGSIAIQIAKHIGAFVAVSATGEGKDFVTQLGADQVVDYKSEDITQVLSEYDALFDTTPGQEIDRVLTILKPGGIAVSMLTGADEAVAQERGVTAITQSTKVTTEALDALCNLIEGGVVTPQVEKVFDLDQIQEAFRAQESGDIRGKVVVAIRA